MKSSLLTTTMVALVLLALIVCQGCSCSPGAMSNVVACSSDGNLVVFGDADRFEPLSLLDRTSNKQTTVGPSGYYHTVVFAPDDGSLFCSFSSDGGTWHIGEIRIGSGEINVLTKGNDFFPAVLSDTKLLFWRSLGRSGDLFGGSNAAELAVFEVDINTLKDRQLTEANFFHVSNIIIHEQRARFTHDELLYALDLESGVLTSEELPDATFLPHCGVGGNAIVGSILQKDPWLVLPAELRNGKLTTLAHVSQINDAAYAEKATMIVLGTILPREIYMLDVESGSLTKVPAKWDR